MSDDSENAERPAAAFPLAQGSKQVTTKGSSRPLSLALLALFAFPVRAQAPAPADPLPGIYVGKSQILDAAPSRQLSLNANVAEYQYQPGGASIAYVGSKWEDGTLTQFIKVAGVKRGQTTTILSESVSGASVLPQLLARTRRLMVQEGQSAQQIAAMEQEEAAEVRANPDTLRQSAQAVAGIYEIDGWSSDGKFLLVHVTREDLDDLTQPGTTTLSRVDMTASEPRPRPLLLPDPPPGKDAMHPTLFWSPGHARLAIEQRFLSVPHVNDTPFQIAHLVTLYDPSSDKTYPLPIPDGLEMTGWVDENHLLLRQTEGKRLWFSHDMTSGKDVDIARPNQSSNDGVPAPKGLTLEAEAHKILKRDKTSVVDSYALWVKRTSGPQELSAVPIGLTPGPEFPNPSWSPRGNQIAYVSHGDLFVTDLLTRPAGLAEMYAAGEKLPCPEERRLATSNLRQIGLALIQYSQDYDETLPMGDGRVNDAIQPYVKNADITRFGPNKFVYTPPPALGLASVAKPAETVIGTYDTRCAFIKLYADGHVSTLPKPGFENAFEKEAHP